MSEDDKMTTIPTVYKQDVIDQMELPEAEEVVPKNLIERSLLTSLINNWKKLKTKYHIAQDYNPEWESDHVVVKGYTPMRYVGSLVTVPKKLEKEVNDTYEINDDDHAIYYKMGYTLSEPHHVFLDIEIREDTELEWEISSDPNDGLETTVYEKVPHDNFHANLDKAFQKILDSYEK